MDETRHLRPAAWPGGGKRVFLGDVGKAALAALGAHEVPVFREIPGYDEQRWELEANSGDLMLKIRSAPYWGFGLFARCFLNEIEVTGPLAERSRFIFDLVVALGRDPWLPAWGFAFGRASGAGATEHRGAWTGLIAAGRETLREDIDRVRDRADAIGAKPDSHAEALSDVDAEIASAEAALLERNAPAVARALGRAERALLYADPTTRPEESEDEATPAGETLSAGEARQNSLAAEHVEALTGEVSAAKAAAPGSAAAAPEFAPPDAAAGEVSARESNDADESDAADVNEAGERVKLSETEKSVAEEIPFVDLT
jgi:hypothetical protein